MAARSFMLSTGFTLLLAIVCTAEPGLLPFDFFKTMSDDSDISAEAAPLRFPLALEIELPSVGPPAVEVDVFAFSPDFVKQPSR